MKTHRSRKSAASATPFYTGKQKFVDTAGRVERFQKKYAKFATAQAGGAGGTTEGAKK